MKLSDAITEYNNKYFSMQDLIYTWFLSDENEGVKEFIESSPAPLHRKYIIDNGDYSLLLADVDGKVGRLSPSFELSEDSVLLEDNMQIMSRIITVNEHNEIVRYIPAKSEYEFPLIDDEL